MPVAVQSANHYCSGAPSNGVDEVQRITIGGTPTSGTFKLTFGGETTAAITWSSNNATLISNIDAALEALANIGANEVTTADVNLASGIGALSVTFVGALGKLALPMMTVSDITLDGGGTVTVTQTTAGVTATARDAAVGEILESDNGNRYVNNGAANAPRWVLLE